MTAPTSPATELPRPQAARDRQGGFTLVEVVLALAIVSLLAALALPAIRPAGGRAMLGIKASEAAALLRADRNAALATGQFVTTRIDLADGRLVAGASDRTLRLPEQAGVRVVPAGLDGVRFSGDGVSSGGRIELGGRGGGMAVNVDPRTAAVSIEPY